MTPQEKALYLHDKKGYNCAQAVACVLCENMDISQTDVLRSCEGFGFGMGNAICTCGAVSGAVYAAGVKNSDGNLDGPMKKTDTYKLSKAIVEKFNEKNQTLVCSELKISTPDHTPVPCRKCIADAVSIGCEVLEISE